MNYNIIFNNPYIFLITNEQYDISLEVVNNQLCIPLFYSKEDAEFYIKKNSEVKYLATPMEDGMIFLEELLEKNQFIPDIVLNINNEVTVIDSNEFIKEYSKFKAEYNIFLNDYLNKNKEIDTDILVTLLLDSYVYLAKENIDIDKYFEAVYSVQGTLLGVRDINISEKNKFYIKDDELYIFTSIEEFNSWKGNELDVSIRKYKSLRLVLSEILKNTKVHNIIVNPNTVSYKIPIMYFSI